MINGTDSTEMQRHWWERRSFLVLLVLLAGVPLLYPTVPPLTDLPGHIGRYAVQLGLDTSPALQAWYGFKWQLIGNLGVDLLVQLFGPVFGIEPTVKAIVIMIPMIQVAGFLLVAREAHGRVPPTAFFALPLAYAYPFQFGFVNFSLSMGLAFLALALWMALGRRGQLTLRAILFAPISVALWLCHMYGWAAFGVLAGSVELFRQRQSGKSWFASGFATSMACLVLVGPVLIMLGNPGGQTGSGVTAGWFLWGQKESWLLLALRDRWMIWDIATVFFLCLVILGGLSLFILRSVRGDNLTHSGPILLSAGLFLLLFLLIPMTVFGSAYADMRLIPFVLVTGLIAIQPLEWTAKRFRSVLATIGIALFVMRIGGTTISYARYSDTINGELKALDQIPREARLLSLVGRPCKEDWSVHRLEHLPGLALARRHAFSNDQWNLAGGQLLTVHNPEAGKFANDPSQFVFAPQCARINRERYADALRAFPRAGFDYLWVINAPNDPGADLGGLQPIWHLGRSSVYRVIRPVAVADRPESR
jgi:hypothetical protein